MQIISIGCGAYVVADRIKAILPVFPGHDRQAEEARLANRFLDCTCGKRRQSKIVMDTGLVIMCAVSVETLSSELKLT
jgi:regulator of extracellular matrix RemA (YlzA/DUF370 family)